MSVVPRLALCASALASIACDDAGSIPAIAQVCTAGGSCPCTGFLVNPTTVVTARHCDGGLNRIKFDVGAPDEVTFDASRRCRNEPSDPACAPLVDTDLDLFFLDTPVPTEVSRPVRIGTESDRMTAGSVFGAGLSGGELHIVDYFPGSVRDCDAVGQGDSFPGESLCIPSTPTAFPAGNSGAPLLAATDDGELAAVGVYHGFSADYDQFQNLSHYADLVPGIRRPPFLDFNPWRWKCVFDFGPIFPLMVATSFRASDFDGDGDDDAFFFVDGADPMLLLGPDLKAVKAGPLSDSPIYPYTLAPADWGDRAGLAGVDEEFRLRTFALADQKWSSTSLPPIDLRQYDPLWGVEDLDDLGEDDPDLVTDPLLRPGDVNGDGRTDLVAVLEKTLLVLGSYGQDWKIGAHALEDLGIPNAQAYRETITLADVDPAFAGDEIIARDECGLVVFAIDGEAIHETYHQPCDDDPWIAGDLQGYAEHNRWSIATGNLDGDACEDIMIRAATRVYSLHPRCKPGAAFDLVPGPDVGATWFEPFSGYEGWGVGQFGGRMLLTDLDGDGLDDLVGNGPHGVEARGNLGGTKAGAAFGSMAGFDEEQIGMVDPWLPIEDWGSVRPVDFDTGTRQLISLSSAAQCVRLWWR